MRKDGIICRKAGDKVISTNPETFETAKKIVIETYIREDTN